MKPAAPRGHSVPGCLAGRISLGLRCSYARGWGCQPGPRWRERPPSRGPSCGSELPQSLGETWGRCWRERAVRLCRGTERLELGSEHRNHYPVFRVNKFYFVPLSGTVLFLWLWHPELPHDKRCNKYLVHSQAAAVYLGNIWFI